ncbi:Interleukin-12 subunit alpha, partial [Cuculus canorus]
QDLSILGFECTLEEVDLEDITKNQTNTIKACTSEDPEVKKKQKQNPQTCIKFQHHIFIEQLKCLLGIYEDLNAYRAELRNFDDQKLLASIDEMMMVSI